MTLSLLEGLPRGAENSLPRKNFRPEARGQRGEWKCCCWSTVTQAAL